MWAILLTLLSCGGGGKAPESARLVTLPGTTTRISERAQITDGKDLALQLYTTAAQCSTLTNTDEEYAVCMPHVDRASGEVRLSFDLREPGSPDPFPLPLTTDHVRVLHDRRPVVNNAYSAFELIPHNPQAARQLFIIVVDGSGSMNDVPRGKTLRRIEQVRQALLTPGVKDAFFPGTVKTGVSLFVFSKGTPQPLGGRIQILEDKGAYRDALQRIPIPGSFTHLYAAVKYATGELLQDDTIGGWLDRYDAEPTVIVLTDGFNNTEAREVCGDNAEKRYGNLNQLLQELRKVRRAKGGRRPRVYTVGLGEAIQPEFVLPNARGTEISGEELCDSEVNTRIDGVLEEKGIDNVSLEWIAAFGGGNAYVSQSTAGLGRAFEQAAAKRYMWFEARYRVSPAYLRRQFTSTIELTALATGEASVEIHPSAWLDAPPGVVAPDGWTRPASYRRSLSVVLPLLGVVVTGMFLGAAGFNTRRVLSGRTRPPKPPGR